MALNRIRRTLAIVALVLIPLTVASQSSADIWTANRTHAFFSVASGVGYPGMLVMDVKDGKTTTNWQPLWLWVEHRGNAQKFFEYYRDTDGAEVYYTYNADWKITNHAIHAEVNQEGYPLIAFQYYGSDLGRWYPVHYADNYSRCGGWKNWFLPPDYANCEAKLLVANTQLAIDDQYSGTAIRTPLWMWRFHGGESQLWWDMVTVG